MDKAYLPNEITTHVQEIKRQNRKFIVVIIGLVSILAVLIGYWFNKNKAYANLEPSNGSNVVQLSSASVGCGTSGSGGCGSGTATRVSAPELEQQALATYKAEFGDKEGIKAVVMDLGCHQEVNIIDKDSNLLKRYSYRGGQLTLL